MGEGGVLSIHDAAARAQRSGNSFAAWREVTPQHNALVEALLNSSAHLIATMRQKSVWEVVEDDRGKKAPKKIGLAPVQREGMEYEFTVVLDIDAESHLATASKDRTRLFVDQHLLLTPDHGRMLREWLESGEDEVASMLARLRASATDMETLRAVYADLWRTSRVSLRDRLRAEYEALKADLLPAGVAAPADDAPPASAASALSLEERAAQRAAALRDRQP
jgi:hypothetical protein